MTKNKPFHFGEDVEGYDMPVLNEREIRAAAGILFLALFVAIMLVLLKGNFLLIKYVVCIFFTDLLLRVFLGPRFSPFLILGRLIVSRQVPEYVAAPQKKFAWKIGIGLSGLMFILLVIVNSYSVLTGLSCFICLLFLFFESSFGICLGCLVYPLFYKTALQHCPGEVCTPRQKQPIQKVSRVQILVLLAFLGYLVMIGLLLQPRLKEPPKNLWTIIAANQ